MLFNRFYFSQLEKLCQVLNWCFSFSDWSRAPSNEHQFKSPFKSMQVKIIPCFWVLSASRGTQYFDSTSSFWSTLLIACWRVTRCSWFMFFDDKILRETEQALKTNSKWFLIMIWNIIVILFLKQLFNSFLY